MRAPVRASSTWGNHRGGLSTPSLSSKFTAVPAGLYQQSLVKAEPFSSSALDLKEASSMASQSPEHLESLKKHLSYDTLDALRNFWFEHLTDDSSRVIPARDMMKRCAEFSPALEAIRTAGVASAQEILSIAQPRNALDWLSLVILLDQIPRNSYRGDRASICFTYFDPLAQELSLGAIEQGLPDEAPEIRWVFSHRSWFYLPLMHSEDLAAHDKAASEYDLMNKDILSLTEGSGGADPYEKKAREAVQADPEAAKTLGKTNQAFEEKHRAIIARFGRYPHRNKALGREPRPEETEFLENGGDTFGS
ncbi:hypothetical protein F66182_7002 [Fusarium sp. NRRL 66182]|nr:hypothetical protein F66182_7002 [Fusarium sp. NRRL 66182]